MHGDIATDATNGSAKQEALIWPGSGVNMPIRLLLVEDDVLVGRMTQRVLKRAGVHVSFVTSATAALTMLSEQHFDVILSDIHMPGMTGLELCERISPAMRKRTILYTGSPEGIVPPMGIRILAKPVSIRELCAVVFQAAHPK